VLPSSAGLPDDWFVLCSHSIDDKRHGVDHLSPVGESMEKTLSACLQKCIKISRNNVCVGVTFRHEKTAYSGGNSNCWLKGAAHPRSPVSYEDEDHVNLVTVYNTNTCMSDTQCRTAYITGIIGAATGMFGTVGVLIGCINASYKALKRRCTWMSTAPSTGGSSHPSPVPAGTTNGTMPSGGGVV
jgi:hypothetical protein